MQVLLLNLIAKKKNNNRPFESYNFYKIMKTLFGIKY